MSIEHTNQGNTLTIDLAAIALEDAVETKIEDDFGDGETTSFSENAIKTLASGRVSESGELIDLPPDTPTEIEELYQNAVNKAIDKITEEDEPDVFENHVHNVNDGTSVTMTMEQFKKLSKNADSDSVEEERARLLGELAALAKKVKPTANVNIDEVNNSSDVEKVSEVINKETDEEAEVVKEVAYSAAPVAMNVKYKYPVWGEKAKSNQLYITRSPKRITRITNEMKNWTASERVNNNEFDIETAVDIHRAIREYEELGDNALIDSFIDGRGWYENILDNPERSWRQDLLNENEQDFSARQAKVEGSDKARVLTGSNAINRITSLIGSGLGTRVALIHSGFHVHLKPPSDADLFNLELELALAKSQAGFDSNGVIFQNSQYGIVEKVFQFIMSHVADMNIIDFRNHDMAEHIRVPDLALLYWAMASAMYPQGFQIELPCSNDPGICRHREIVHANIYRLRWYDETRLSEFQLDMLRKAKTKFDIKDLAEYQKAPGSHLNRRVTVSEIKGEKIDVQFRVPTVADYLESGRRFVESAKDALSRVMTQDQLNEEQKQIYVASQMRLAALCEYAYWIEALYIGKDIINDNNSILESLAALTADKDIYNAIHREVQLYIEENTMALIAIPNFSCPKCGHDYSTDENSKHPELVPINPLKLFFDLQDRRLHLRKQNLTS